MQLWRLRRGADRRFRAGHPWVYSNELAESPKGIAPGELVELCDAGGGFLGRGHGNPSSLIALRALSRDRGELDPLGAEGLARRLGRASALRLALGLGGTSHRLVFAEGDGLPGLVVDSYALSDMSRVLVVQAHTAGMDAALPAILDALGGLCPGAGLVVRNDVGARALDGISVEPPRVARCPPGVDLSSVRIRVAGLELEADLEGGQKTGFFLDQAANLALAAERLAGLEAREPGTAVRVLDLCCYVGQWGAYLARAISARGRRAHVTLVDSSARALEVAARNVAGQGADVEPVRADVLRELTALPTGGFDLVVADPPALIGRRKDVPQGTHAYLQLFTQAVRLVRPGGGLVACSCSALLEEAAFDAALAKAARRNDRTVRWIARGGQAPDHPVLLEFPEGRYLKCWVGVA